MPEDDDLAALADARVEVDRVLVDQADAARRRVGADRVRLQRTVDPEIRVLVALPQVHGAGAERIAIAAGDAHAALQLVELRLELGMTVDHLGRRIPIRPFLLGLDVGLAGPDEAGLADGDAVAHRAAVRLDEIEVVGVRIDHDRARLLDRRIVDLDAVEALADDRLRHAKDLELVLHRLIQRGEARIERGRLHRLRRRGDGRRRVQRELRAIGAAAGERQSEGRERDGAGKPAEDRGGEGRVVHDAPTLL